MARASRTTVSENAQNLTSSRDAECVAGQGTIGCRAVEVGQETIAEDIDLIEVDTPGQIITTRAHVTNLKCRASKFPLEAKTVLLDLRDLDLGINGEDRTEVTPDRRRVIEQITTRGNECRGRCNGVQCAGETVVERSSACRWIDRIRRRAPKANIAGCGVVNTRNDRVVAVDVAIAATQHCLSLAA